jgi:hypothetical protein
MEPPLRAYPDRYISVTEIEFSRFKSKGGKHDERPD